MRTIHATVVVAEKGDLLFGRDMIKRFQLEPSAPEIKLAPVEFCTNKVKMTREVDPKINSLLSEFKDVLNDKISQVNNFHAKIRLSDEAKPVIFRPRPIPFALKEAADIEIDRLLNEGVLVPVDGAVLFASPVVYEQKSNGRVRLCADFKVSINKYVLPEPHPLPTFEEITAELNGFTDFSKIDLKDAYLQIPVDEESKKYLTIATHRGYFTFQRLPFGLKTAPEIFSKYMDTVLAGTEGVKWFIDDIITGGKTTDEHIYSLYRAGFFTSLLGVAVRNRKWSACRR